MIVLHRLNGEEFLLNDIHIETIEANPDSVILLTNDRRYVVKESVEEILEKILKHSRQINVVKKK